MEAAVVALVAVAVAAAADAERASYCKEMGGGSSLMLGHASNDRPVRGELAVPPARLRLRPAGFLAASTLLGDAEACDGVTIAARLASAGVTRAEAELVSTAATAAAAAAEAVVEAAAEATAGTEAVLAAVAATVGVAAVVAAVVVAIRAAAGLRTAPAPACVAAAPTRGALAVPRTSKLLLAEGVSDCFATLPSALLLCTTGAVAAGLVASPPGAALAGVAAPLASRARFSLVRAAVTFCMHNSFLLGMSGGCVFAICPGRGR